MHMLKLAAAAALAAAAGTGAAAIAHPHADGEGKEIRRIVVLDGEGKEKVKDVHTREIRNELGERLAKCEGKKTEIDETTGGEEKQRTRIVICGDTGTDQAVRAEKLEKALARISENDKLSPEHRERVTTALREAISRMRETN